MGRRKPFSEVQRAPIVIPHGEGFIERQMSINIIVGNTAVYWAIKKFQLYSSNKVLKRSGKPYKATIQDDHLIKRVLARSTISSAKKNLTALILGAIGACDMTV